MKWIGTNGTGSFPPDLELGEVGRHVVEVTARRTVKTHTDKGESTVYDVMLWTGPSSASVARSIWTCAAIDAVGGLTAGRFYLLDCRGGAQSKRNKRNTYHDVRIAEMDDSDIKALAKGGSIDDLIGMVEARTPF